MNRFTQIIVPLILFSVLFYILRTNSLYDVSVLVHDLGGLTYLYSTVGIIFAIFAAFIILNESERWNSLFDAVKGEVGQLNELWLWSQHLPEHLKNSMSQDIKKYLKVVIKKAWAKDDKGNPEIEKVLNSLHNNIYQILQDAPALMPTAFNSFSELIKFREKRLHYSTYHLPTFLKQTHLFCSCLLLVFSLFIGVQNVWLDYIFVLGIFALVYIINLLIDDLDNPIRPGSFFMTTKDYEELLKRISKK